MCLQRILATAFAVPELSLGIGSSAALAQVSEPAQATTIARPANAQTDYSRGLSRWLPRWPRGRPQGLQEEAALRFPPGPAEQL